MSIFKYFYKTVKDYIVYKYNTDFRVAINFNIIYIHKFIVTQRGKMKLC